jgi:hypothetical protein
LTVVVFAGNHLIVQNETGLLNILSGKCDELGSVVEKDVCLMNKAVKEGDLVVCDGVVNNPPGCITAVAVD